MIWRCDLVPQFEAHRAEILEAIERVLRSGRYVLADEVTALEREIATYVGRRFGVGVANATDGLTLALKAVGVRPGDEVITTPFTAIPTISAIVAAGARPVFADIDPDTLLLDVERAAKAITDRTRAVMPVHLFGNVLDVGRLRSAVGAIPIVEDAAQAIGSRIHDRMAGSGGDAAVFSFYPTKNLGAYGDGGMVVTDDPEIAARLRSRRMYGMVDKDHVAEHGVNSRIDELQAAVLRAKLPHLDTMNAHRNRIAQEYISRLPEDLFRFQHLPDGVVSNYHVFPTRYAGDRDRLIRELEARDIQTNIYYPLPHHLQEANREMGLGPGSFPAAESVCADILALPMYPELPQETLELVIAAILDIVGSSA